MSDQPQDQAPTGFPDGFFSRSDESGDDEFYAMPRLVTHIDDRAIAAVSELYTELGLSGRLLDLMSSWISHLPKQPDHLTVLGMNRAELALNEMAHDAVVHDLNLDPVLPFHDNAFDGAMCVVSVDYLTRPIEVFGEVARVLSPGAPFVCTFSNRCFPTKAIRGWMSTDDEQHCHIVAEYFRQADGWEAPVVDVRIPAGFGTDPLYAIWAKASG